MNLILKLIIILNDILYFVPINTCRDSILPKTKAITKKTDNNLICTLQTIEKKKDIDCRTRMISQSELDEIKSNLKSENNRLRLPYIAKISNFINSIIDSLSKRLEEHNPNDQLPFFEVIFPTIPEPEDDLSFSPIFAINRSNKYHKLLSLFQFYLCSNGLQSLIKDAITLYGKNAMKMVYTLLKTDVTVFPDQALCEKMLEQKFEDFLFELILDKSLKCNFFWANTKEDSLYKMFHDLFVIQLQQNNVNLKHSCFKPFFPLSFEKLTMLTDTSEKGKRIINGSDFTVVPQILVFCSFLDEPLSYWIKSKFKMGPSSYTMNLFDNKFVKRGALSSKTYSIKAFHIRSGDAGDIPSNIRKKDIEWKKIDGNQEVAYEDSLHENHLIYFMLFEQDQE